MVHCLMIRRWCGGVAGEKGRLLSGEGKGGDNPPDPLDGCVTAHNSWQTKICYLESKFSNFMMVNNRPLKLTAAQLLCPATDRQSTTLPSFPMMYMKNYAFRRQLEEA